MDPLDLDPRAAVACGRWDWTGASDLDPTAGIACERPKRRRSAEDGGARRRVAANGGGARRCTQSRAPVHDLKRGWHLCAAREHAKQDGAAVAAELRRSGRSTRRRGPRTPARSSGPYGARTRRLATRARCSPPDTARGQLQGDEAAARRGTEGGGARVSVAAQGGG
jgi:hypothetical protein